MSESICFSCKKQFITTKMYRFYDLLHCFKCSMEILRRKYNG